ncbi:MAG: carboxypeptidase regulatory-like domain-containing protein [Planctomycetes bacterium]|nr:carboxypeptidase regulatory-like domain-containing protein [Planctomycetota bacterium]
MRALAMTLCAFLVGCGASEGPAAPATDVAAAPAPVAAPTIDAEELTGNDISSGGGDWSEDKGTATVKGTVKFEGEAPKRRPIDVGSEAFCVQAHKDEPLRSEIVVVGAEGGLANVFIQVTAGLESWKFPDATGEVVLDQHGCQYIPHVLVAQVGQTLKVKNSDPIMHNVHGINKKTSKDEFNWAQTKAGLEDTKELKKAGGIEVKCDVHGWMSSHVWIVKHPFFAVTGEDGAFTLPKLPAGTYTIEAWHEKLGTKTASVTVGDGEAKEVSFSFSLK